MFKAELSAVAPKIKVVLLKPGDSITYTASPPTPLPSEIENLKNQLTGEINSLKSQLTDETKNLRSQLAGETESLRRQLNTQIYITYASIALAIIATITALIAIMKRK